MHLNLVGYIDSSKVDYLFKNISTLPSPILITFGVMLYIYPSYEYHWINMTLISHAMRQCGELTVKYSVISYLGKEINSS